jgi:hypothetical protein
MSDYGDQIFENYELFIKEHKSDISTPSEAIEMLSSDGAFRAYIDALTEGLTSHTKNNILAIAEREREMLLEESINLGPSASVVGYAVSYFPILTDIYSDPILSEIVTTYPTNKPILTIPKINVSSKVKNTDGSIVTHSLPSSSNLVRASAETITLTPGTANYLHSLSAGGLVTVDNAFVNKRYFIVTNVQVTASDGSNIDIPVMIRPDSRGQLNYSAEFADPSGDTLAANLIGNVNFDNGAVNFSATFGNVSSPTTPVPGTVAINSINSDVVFSPRTGDVGRVKVSISTSGWDISVDVKDSFEIQLDQEVIQDYTDIYNVDMLRTLSMAIKNQILYNKEADLAYYLRVHEPVFNANGSAATYNMAAFTAAGGAGNFTPANVLDIFKGVIPHITSVNRNIRKLFRADPQYIVAGLKTASLLESLQAYMVGFQTHSHGEAGFSSQNAMIDFRKQRILASNMIEDDKIYMVYRAPSDDLSRTAIADIIYKPLYILEEIDQSQRRTYIKSRSTIELTAPEALGVVTMTNFSAYL